MEQGKGNTIKKIKLNLLQKWRNQIKSKKQEKIKLIIMKKNPAWKRMRCVFFFQTSNLHPNKQKYKSEKETLYFYYTK